MKTVLHDQHLALKAKMVDFCGFEMSLYYQGILEEHKIVRTDVGIFDVSHMGIIDISGIDALLLLNYLSTNQLENKKEGTAVYTVLTNAKGGCVDDVLVYKKNDEHFLLVVNACNRKKVLDHLIVQSVKFNVAIKDHFENLGILSIQGPKSLEVGEKIFPNIQSLSHMHFKKDFFNGVEIIFSKTGYTGELGFEIFAPNEIIIDLWKVFLEKGVTPIGLGARDTLRLEKGYALYGHELAEDISPLESVAFWTVKLDKDFLGKENLKKNRFQFGVIILDKVIARAHDKIFKENKEMGYVTSGSFSPSLKIPIAIILVEEKLKKDDVIEIIIREKRCKAKVVSLPFL